MKKPFIKLGLAVFIAGLFGTSIASASTFADVKPTDWFYTYVEQLAANGVIDSSVQNYRPADLVNRAEIAKMAVNTFGLTVETPTIAPFKDVALNQWYTSYIYTAQKNNLIGGYKDASGAPTGYFGPSDPLTREQAAKIMVLAAPLAINTAGGPHFSDVEASRWSYQDIETAYNWGVVDGYADKTFKPENSINRAEIAKLFVNASNPPPR